MRFERCFNKSSLLSVDGQIDENKIALWTHSAIRNVMCVHYCHIIFLVAIVVQCHLGQFMSTWSAMMEQLNEKEKNNVRMADCCVSIEIWTMQTKWCTFSTLNFDVIEQDRSLVWIFLAVINLSFHVRSRFVFLKNHFLLLLAGEREFNCIPAFVRLKLDAPSWP